MRPKEGGKMPEEYFRRGSEVVGELREGEWGTGNGRAQGRVFEAAAVLFWSRKI
jgi:hypothetical protein